MRPRWNSTALSGRTPLSTLVFAPARVIDPGTLAPVAYPRALVPNICKNPANPGCVWISDWGTFQTGYLSLPTGWSNGGADYGAEAARALSFMTTFTVGGCRGEDPSNFFTNSDAADLGIVYHHEPQWSISPLW